MVVSRASGTLRASRLRHVADHPLMGGLALEGIVADHPRRGQKAKTHKFGRSPRGGVYVFWGPGPKTRYPPKTRGDIMLAFFY